MANRGLEARFTALLSQMEQVIDDAVNMDSEAADTIGVQWQGATHTLLNIQDLLAELDLSRPSEGSGE